MNHMATLVLGRSGTKTQNVQIRGSSMNIQDVYRWRTNVALPLIVQFLLRSLMLVSGCVC